MNTSNTTKMILQDIPRTVPSASLNAISSNNSISSEGRIGTFKSVRDDGKRKHAEQPSHTISDADISTRIQATVAPIITKKQKHSNIRLLAVSEDATVLNPLHNFVRMQIEVFTATATDMVQPAPGRKTPVKLHQVGLRCIHCKNLPPGDRVKRAVCFPRSVGRVYHSVSDMKFDHFSKCRGFSDEMRVKFGILKNQNKRRGNDKKSSVSSSSSAKSASLTSLASTAQYYRDCARKLGMVDACGGGIFMDSDTPCIGGSNQSSPILSGTTNAPFPVQNLPAHMLVNSSLVYPMGSTNCPNQTGRHLVQKNTSAPVMLRPPTTALLASHEDSKYLNSLHCFVRRNVEAFVATEEEISAPAPGRKIRVTVGQVGIRCIHCARLPLHNRAKRSVCYPPSVSGIYHSVSNMKFDHFGVCQGLPADARSEFTNLKASCGRRNGNSSSCGGRDNGIMSNSTARFYYDSAVRLGLVDTQTGIRFSEQQHHQHHQGPAAAERGRESSSPNSVAHDGISVLMMAATRT